MIINTVSWTHHLELHWMFFQLFFLCLLKSKNKPACRIRVLIMITFVGCWPHVLVCQYFGCPPPPLLLDSHLTMCLCIASVISCLSVCPSVCLSVNFHIFDFFSRTTTKLGTKHRWVRGVHVGSCPFPWGS